MSRLALITLVGLPASGKSSLCSRLVEASINGLNFVCLCFDELLSVNSLELFDVKGEWKRLRKALLHSIEMYIASFLGDSSRNISLTEEEKRIYSQLPALPSFKETKVVFLLDDNFYYSSMRHEYFLLAKQFNLGFGTLVCKCPVALCLERNSRRHQAVPGHVILGMNEKIEWPNSLSFFWEKHSMEIDTSSNFDLILIDLIRDFSLTVLAYPFDSTKEQLELERSEADRLINAESLLHSIDMVLRRAVRDFLSGKDKTFKSANAILISNIRLQTLNNIKTEILTGRLSTLSSEKCQAKALDLFQNSVMEAIPDLLNS